MNMRTIGVVLAVFFISALPCAAVGEPAAPENLSNLIATALADNPELKASTARWELFRNRIEQARALDDPMLMLKLQNGVIRSPLDWGRDGMTAKVLGLSQQVPFWGKRSLKGEVAQKEADFYKWTLEERKLELMRMVKETYYQIFVIDRSLAIVDRNIRIFDDFIILAQTKYSVGQGVQQDIFKAQVERSKMLDLGFSLQQQRTSRAAELNALLNRPAATPVGAIADFTLVPFSLTSPQLAAIAEEYQPDLHAARALLEKAQVGRKLADKEYFPDVTVALEYMQRDPAMGSDGADMYSLGVAFNLPVQRSRRQAARAESNAEASMAAEELNSQRNTIQAGIADLLAQLERRWKQAELYKKGIIPQARQSLESAVIGYRVNKVDFLTLLDSSMTLFTYEREYYEVIADYQMKRAQLEALVGKEL
jgi:outer membrane protein, heavy metal efflux system